MSNEKGTLKLQKATNIFYICVPKKLVEGFGFKQGDGFKWRITSKGEIALRKVSERVPAKVEFNQSER